MDFNDVMILSNLISKDYSADMFRLLVNYKDISASEAATRLNLHIRTVQDFLEGLNSFGITEKYETSDRKTYFRYFLKDKKIRLDIDLEKSFSDTRTKQDQLSIYIREKKGADVVYKTVGTNDFLSNMTIFTGKGRDRKEWKISLTLNQGSFLYNLPFPNSEPKTVKNIMEIGKVDEEYLGEVTDIIDLLASNGVIDIINTR